MTLGERTYKLRTENEYDAFQCEMGERSYLCWTISPEISCIIEYSTDTVAETDIFQMASSVLPQV